ncbi:MAG: hypothetical protein Q4C56_00700 [Peptococcaceae bacterium]|nr:hypothetical protein [Peptococcaceae bacterium]
MVGGLEKFKEYFAEYSNQYVLIGGAACDIIMEDFDSAFRATKDLDLVLIVEALTPEFAQAFWQFVEDGQYGNRRASTQTPQFYRFDKPQVRGFPYMLELFSRNNFELRFPESHLMPLHLDDDVSSLSAILLNDAYYEMLLDGRIEIDGVRVLAPSYIIPFKAKAWLDLSEKKRNGEHVDEKNIRKHKNDIARLATILNDRDVIQLPEEVARDMHDFIRQYEMDPVDMKSLKMRGVTNRQVVDRLKQIYRYEP